MRKEVHMSYIVTSITPETKKEQLRQEAARHVYEQLLRFINEKHSDSESAE